MYIVNDRLRSSHNDKPVQVEDRTGSREGLIGAGILPHVTQNRWSAQTPAFLHDDLTVELLVGSETWLPKSYV